MAYGSGITFKDIASLSGRVIEVRQSLNVAGYVKKGAHGGWQYFVGNARACALSDADLEGLKTAIRSSLGGASP